MNIEYYATYNYKTILDFIFRRIYMPPSEVKGECLIQVQVLFFIIYEYGMTFIERRDQVLFDLKFLTPKEEFIGGICLFTPLRS